MSLMDRALEPSGEIGAVLGGLRRWSEALEIYSRAIAGAGRAARRGEKARLLRGQAFALTELERYDEAVAVYRASLRLDPANRLAISELAHIARLRVSLET